MITIGFTMGPNGPVPDIDWPKTLLSDQQVLEVVHYIRKAGIGATTHIKKSSSTTDVLEIHTEHGIAIYRKGLYQEPVKPYVSLWNDEVGPPTWALTAPPQECWIFDDVAQVGLVEGEEYARLAGELSRHIPDIRKKVKSPCRCPKWKEGSIFLLIQHLNDHHHPKARVNGLRIKDVWTRERIADWLDELDADLMFDPDLPAKREAKRKATRLAQIEAMKQAGVMPQDVLLKQISGELKAVEPKIDELKGSLVKLDVAIEQFAVSIHESLTKAHQTCACEMCTKKEES